MRSGKVLLVGAGPGDMGLVTLKALSSLQTADVVVYDQLVNPELLAHAHKNAEIIFAGKYAGNHILAQQEINRVLIAKARQGKMVLRLKGGDPLLFGRGAEEALELAKAKVPFEIVPGVSSAYSVPAYAGIPVTYRHISSRVTIVTGHEMPDKGKAVIPWKKLLDKDSTLVILMGFGNLATIVRQVGTTPEALRMPVALISNGTRPEQMVVSGQLSNIVARVKASGMKAPAIIVIGDVVNLRSKLDWFRPELPLQGKRVLVTRPVHQASALKVLLECRGAKVSAIPLIKIVASGDTARIKGVLAALGRYQWLVFTSANGVDIFLDMMRRHKISPMVLKDKKFAAIGQKTADQLEKNGLSVTLMPRDFVQEALADVIIKAVPRKTSRVLLVHGAGGRPVLEQVLKAAGIALDTLDLYRAVPLTRNHARVRQMITARKLDAVVFTSSSCVESFVSVFDKDERKRMTKNLVFAAIGPVSAATARKSGIAVAVESKEYTMEGVTNALADYCRNMKDKA